MNVTIYSGDDANVVKVIKRHPPATPLPVVLSFTATPSVVTVGALVLLAWQTQDADDGVVIDNGVGAQAANGSATVTPTASLLYTLTASGPGGNAQATASVTVNPVVVPSGKMPVLGTSRMHQQQGWMADWIDASIMEGTPCPFTLGADPANGILALSKNGVEPTRVQAWHLFGNPTELYHELPWFDLQGRSHPYNPETSDDFAQIVADLIARPPSSGERGICMPQAVTTIIPHPTYYGPEDAPKTGVIPRHPIGIWLRHDAVMHLGYHDGRFLEVGKIPGITHSHDACIKGRRIIFVADLGIKNAANVWSGGGIRVVDRAPGGVGIGGTPTEDPNKYAITTLAAAGYPTAVRVDQGNGIVYFVDMDKGGEITKVVDGVASPLCTIPNAFAIDILSSNPTTGAPGKLYVMTTRSEVFIVYLDTGFVGSQLMPPNWVQASPAVRGGDFFTISVDASGTFGPAGNFSCSRVHTTSNTNIWQFSATTVKFANAIYGPSGHSYQTIGDAYNTHEFWGHYDWLGGKHHPDQAVRFVGGYANNPTGIIVADPTMPNGQPYPVQPSLDYTAVWRGWQIIARGGPNDDRQQPSLTCLMSTQGWSRFAGCRNDDIAEMPFDDQEAWIHGGYVGAFRRDDIVGMDLYCVMLHHLAGSQRFIREGTAAYNAFRAWWTSKGRTVTLPAIPFANAGGLLTADKTTAHFDGNNIDYHLEVRETAPGAYRVGIFGNGSADTRYSNALEYTNNPAVGPLPADAVIVVDKGMPSEMTLPGAPAPGWHAFTVRALGWASNATTYKVPG